MKNIDKLKKPCATPSVVLLSCSWQSHLWRSPCHQIRQLPVPSYQPVKFNGNELRRVEVHLKLKHIITIFPLGTAWIAISSDCHFIFKFHELLSYPDPRIQCHAQSTATWDPPCLQLSHLKFYWLRCRWTPSPLEAKLDQLYRLKPTVLKIKQFMFVSGCPVQNISKYKRKKQQVTVSKITSVLRVFGIPLLGASLSSLSLNSSLWKKSNMAAAGSNTKSKRKQRKTSVETWKLQSIGLCGGVLRFRSMWCCSYSWYLKSWHYFQYLPMSVAYFVPCVSNLFQSCWTVEQVLCCKMLPTFLRWHAKSNIPHTGAGQMCGNCWCLLVVLGQWQFHDSTKKWQQN